MKKFSITTTFAFLMFLSLNALGQVTPPPGAGDKDLRDTDVKRRSVEMERIEREAEKSPGKNSKNSAIKTEDRIAAKYAEIKADFEQLQLSQDAIVKAYQSGSRIDYAQIGKSAEEMNRSAIRLDSNLFPAKVLEKDEAKKEEKKKDEAEPKPAKSVRDLIVELDNAIAVFATSPMFQNLRVVDPAVSEKAKLDLKKIIDSSALLNIEAKKMEASGK